MASMRGFQGTMLWLAAGACVAAALPAAGAPRWGETVEIREPDGSSVEVRVWGDEFYSVGETLDGYTVVRDAETGMLSYARLSGDGRALVSTGVAIADPPPVRIERHVRITPEAAREQALAARVEFERLALGGPYVPGVRGERGPTTGPVVGITLLIDFSDDPGTIPPGNVDDYCNLPGYTGYGNNGSVRDYFYDVSDRRLTYTNYVPTAYHRASRTKAYYTDPNIPYGQRARELITEALTAMESAGFDFSLYDADGNGVIDALNCFYAGGVWNSWAEGLWPHAGWMTFCADGVCTERYQITNMGTSLSLATFCHENGHMLMGWPDLYDYDGDSSGVGTYCLMCSSGSSTNPIEPCAYMKYKAGWAHLTVLTETTPTNPVSADSNVIYKFPHPYYWNEYYLIENRQQSGRDAVLPDRGLAIWHVDEYGDNSNQEMTSGSHYLVTLVQADGNWDLENHRNYGDDTDLYGAPVYTDCTPYTYPNTNWWNGTASGHAFSNISVNGFLMTFDYGDSPPPQPQNIVATAGELSVTVEWDGVGIADLDYYTVERDTTPAFGPGTVSSNTTQTGFTDGPITAGIEYFYRVFAVDLAGQPGEPSDIVSGVPTPDVAPSIPLGLIAGGGGGAVNLVWDENPEVDVAGYHVERDTTDAFETSEVLAFVTETSYADSQARAGRGYWYRVAAEDEAGHLSGPSYGVAGIAVPGQSVYVDASNEGPQNGSWTNPWRTIQPAIDQADAGDIVVIFIGTYDAGFSLKDGVPVIGMRGAAVTTVNAAASASAIGSGTVVKGLRFDGAGGVGIALDCFNSYLVVEDCEFTDLTSAGVSCHHGGAPVLKRNRFTGSQFGISCADSAAPRVTSSTFQGNVFTNVFTSGSPGPLLGGSLAGANDFLDHGLYAVFNSGPSEVSAEYNYWGDDCVEPTWFSGPVDYTPWTDATHTIEFTECTSGVDEGGVPLVAYARPSYPNPAVSAVSVAFGLPHPGGTVSLRVYTASGRLIRTLIDEERLPPGHHATVWDRRDDRGESVASGIYFYRLDGPGLEARGKMVVLK
jgi:M6 family metalloprotease-like protein